MRNKKIDTEIDAADLSMELEECAAMADFIAEAVAMIFEGTFTDKAQVPFGASLCLQELSAKLKRLSAQI